jgi:glucose-6-phosphate 1-dehydrogenase
MHMAKIPPGVGPRFPQVVVLFGATGDLAKRKLLPGLYHLATAGFIPQCRVIGVSLDDIDLPAFRQIARGALDQFFARQITDADWDAFAQTLDYVPLAAGAPALARRPWRAAEASLGTECRRLHYLSVPPSAALPAVRLLGEAGLVERARIVMEKPFGTDLASAVHLNRALHDGVQRGADLPHRPLPGQGAGAEHPGLPVCQRPVRADLEPQLHRPCADRRARDPGPGQRSGFYEQTGAYRDMVVTHLFQILAFMAMEPPTALEPQPISEEKNKVFRSMLPIQPGDVVRGQYNGYRTSRAWTPKARPRPSSR